MCRAAHVPTESIAVGSAVSFCKCPEVAADIIQPPDDSELADQFLWSIQYWRSGQSDPIFNAFC
jgi:hypothetical protein